MLEPTTGADSGPARCVWRSSVGYNVITSDEVGMRENLARNECHLVHQFELT